LFIPPTERGKRIEALIASFLFVVLAEMGDKTQLLAMAFAARYSFYKVLIGVALATVFNHALAVTVGHFLTVVVPLDVISFIAALSFIGFGLWTLRGDTLKGEDKKISRFGPIATVAIAFFLAEMGDKTQLATISLAVKYNSMLFVLMGTTLAMLVADSIGILVSVVLCKCIPEKTIKWVSAGIFVIFGFIGVYTALVSTQGWQISVTIVALMAIGVVIAAFYLTRNQRRKTQAECIEKEST
jgi:Ca2+/H+ antiporter, TMEM165/GDT1 family